MALTEAEKERVRYHLGYLGVSDAASLNFGIPASRQNAVLDRERDESVDGSFRTACAAIADNP